MMIVLSVAMLLVTAGTYGFDLPIDLNFQLGFKIHVIPSPTDTSQKLCLGVATDKIRSDKTQTLAISGTITNYSNVPCDGVEMHFAVTSYVGIGTSNGKAVVEPSSIPPGGTATFIVHISLDSEKPQYAKYTITAQTPPLCGQEAHLETPPDVLAPDAAEILTSP